MYSPGAQSDQMLFFKSDGTGRYEEHNWILCGVEYFEWQLLSPNSLQLIGTHSESRAEDGTVSRKAGIFCFPELECSIGKEKTPSGRRMRVLRLNSVTTFQIISGSSEGLSAVSSIRHGANSLAGKRRINNDMREKEKKVWYSSK